MIHGGAGVEPGLSKDEQEAYHKALASALTAAYAEWKKGNDAIHVVEVAVKSLEDCPLFNAGKGAVFTHDGKNELDAAIMNGKTREAGAVASTTIIKNPISAAIAVMQKSPHVILVGEGANQFARDQKLEIVDQKYFWTQKRYDELQEILHPKSSSTQKTKAPAAPSAQKKSMAPQNFQATSSSLIGANLQRHSADENSVPHTLQSETRRPYDHRFGTVGAVVLDKNGNLAAGTSTGGLTNKKWGRVGDSPVIGAGTFADNASCAVSCTGHGEWFIRYNVASDLAARVKYAHTPLKKAADEIIHGVLSAPNHGEGGLICLDKKGNFAMPFNSSGMFRGYVCKDGKPHTFVY